MLSRDTRCSCRPRRFPSGRAPWSVALLFGTLAALIAIGTSCQRERPLTPPRIGVVPFSADSAVAAGGLADVATYGVLWRLGRIPNLQGKPVFLTGELNATHGATSLRLKLASDTTLLRIGLRAGVTYIVHGRLRSTGTDSVLLEVRCVNVKKRRRVLQTRLQVPRDSLVSATAVLALKLVRKTGIGLSPDLRAVLTRTPCKNTRAFTFFARAEMMRLRGGNAFQPDTYRNWIERAAELDMDFFDAAQRLAELDLQRGDFRAAILALTNATRIRPDWVDGYNQLASVLGAYQAPDKVIEVSRKALKYDPENVPALANLGAAYLDKDEPDSAISYLQRALQKEPENWRLLYNLGAAYTKKGDWQNAIETLRKALNKRSDVPEVHYFLGVAYNNAGMPGEAVRWFQRALRLDPHGLYGKLARKHLTTILGYVPGSRR